MLPRDCLRARDLIKGRRRVAHDPLSDWLRWPGRLESSCPVPGMHCCVKQILRTVQTQSQAPPRDWNHVRTDRRLRMLVNRTPSRRNKCHHQRKLHRHFREYLSQNGSGYAQLVKHSRRPTASHVVRQPTQLPIQHCNCHIYNDSSNVEREAPEAA